MTVPGATTTRSSSPSPAADPAVTSSERRRSKQKGSAAQVDGEGSSSSAAASPSPSPRSAPSASIPNAAAVPPQAFDASISNLSSIITRIMVASRFILSGGVDINGTLNDMISVEKCVKKLSKQVERFTTSIMNVAHALGEVAQTVPNIAQAAVRVGTTFLQAFPFLRRFGA